MVKTKTMVVLAMSLVIVVFLAADAAAGIPLTWVFSPDSIQTSGSPTSVFWNGNNLEIGTSTSTEFSSQPVGIYGVSAALPMGLNDTGFVITFDWHFKTWDSYNVAGTTGTIPTGQPGAGDAIVGTGWWDSWSATITKGATYWDAWDAGDLWDPITAPADVEHVFVLEGGTSFNDGWVEQYDGPWTAFAYLPATTSDQYYLNLILDTKTDPAHNGAYPSWGEWTGVTVTPVPAAVILGILGLGVAGIKLRKYA